MPRTLAQNAQYIANTIKPAIKSAIEAQGVTVPSTDSFLDYADRIGEIEGGGSGYQLKDLPTGAISTVNDAAPLPLNALKISVEAWQEGSGDPSPSNIRPIHGWDSGEISVVGKNWLPRYTVTDTQYGVTISGDSDGKVTVNGTVTGTNLYGFILNQTLVLTPDTYTLSGANQGGARLVLYDISDNVLADTDGTTTFTINNNTTIRLRLYVYSAQGLYDEVLEPMIRLASESDATFEPYNGKTATADFNTTIYSGSANLLTGSGSDAYAIVTYDGSENWTKTGAIFFTANGRLFKTDDYTNIIECNRLKTFTNNSNLGTSTDAYGIAGYYDVNAAYPNQNWLYIKNTDCADATELKTWLASNPLQVKFKLATPKAFTFTPIPTIRMLQGTSNLYADCGEVLEGEYFIGSSGAYDLYDYIQTDGTQAIDLGVKVNSGDVINCMYTPLTGMTNWNWLWISEDTNTSKFSGVVFMSSSQMADYDYSVESNRRSWTASQISESSLTASAAINANVKFSDGAIVKLYSLSINNNYFLPCKRKSDGVFGLYDVANQAFLTDSAGGNAFVGGNPTGVEV